MHTDKQTDRLMDILTFVDPPMHVLPMLVYGGPGQSTHALQKHKNAGPKIIQNGLC